MYHHHQCTVSAQPRPASHTLLAPVMSAITCLASCIQLSQTLFVLSCRGIVQLTNQSVCDTLGFQRNELVGRNVNQIIPS
jgi:hypothetical protein